MPKKNLEVDAYIAAAAPLLGRSCAICVLSYTAVVPRWEEKVKWGAPHFDYKGPIAGMAAFKSHCAFGFWKGELIFEEKPEAEEAMGHFGRIEREADLPNDKVLLGYLRKAIELNEAGIKRPQPPRVTGPRKLEIPPDWRRRSKATPKRARPSRTSATASARITWNGSWKQTRRNTPPAPNDNLGMVGRGQVTQLEV